MIARTPPHQSRRTAATLTEVLMALLVMGIGITSVMYIFPLSLLRAIEANKLTNATLLKQNAMARINSIATPVPRGIITDPDLDGNVSEHQNPDDEWFWFIFDPLGANVLAGDSAQYANGVSRATMVGGIDNNNDRILDTPIGIAPEPFSTIPRVIQRTAAGLGTIPDAEDFVTLPDSFITLADALLLNPANVTQTTVAVPDADFSGYSIDDIRLTVFHAGTGISAVRKIESFAGNTLTIDSDPANPVTGRPDLPTDNRLPAAFAGNVGRVIVEIPERRYTWLATIRRTPGDSSPSVTVVVFFRRSFAPEDERVYVCAEPGGSYNEFSYDPSTAGNGGIAEPPGLVAGGWMFDASAFRWWKISSVRKQGSLVRFTVDPEEYDSNPGARGPVYAMFPRNVVQAYTLEKD